MFLNLIYRQFCDLSNQKFAISAMIHSFGFYNVGQESLFKSMDIPHIDTVKMSKTNDSYKSAMVNSFESVAAYLKRGHCCRNYDLLPIPALISFECMGIFFPSSYFTFFSTHTTPRLLSSGHASNAGNFSVKTFHPCTVNFMASPKATVTATAASGFLPAVSAVAVAGRQLSRLDQG